MAGIEQGLRIFIEQGTPEAGKGYPLEAPQDATRPAFSYQVINDTPTIAHSGRVVLRKAVIQITVVAENYQQAKHVQAILTGKLDGFKGRLGEVQAEFCKTSVSDNWADIQQLPSVSFDVTIIYLP